MPPLRKIYVWLTSPPNLTHKSRFKSVL